MLCDRSLKIIKKVTALLKKNLLLCTKSVFKRKQRVYLSEALIKKKKIVGLKKMLEYTHENVENLRAVNFTK